MVVNDTRGTTTDAISVAATFNGHDVRLIDTAGISSDWRYPFYILYIYYIYEIHPIYRIRTDLLSSEITTQVIRSVIESQISVIVIDATEKTPDIT